MRHAVVFTLAAVLAGSLSSAMATPTAGSMQELGRLSLGFDPMLRGPFAIADFDRDGADDLVLGGRAGSDMLLEVYGWRSGTYLSKQMLVISNELGGAPRMLAHVEGGQTHLYVFMADGKTYDFAGWPLHQVRSFDLGMEVTAAAIGDIDNDGSDELVVGASNWGTLGVFDLATATVRWTLPDMHPTDLLLAQLDADPALEIVVGGVPGFIVDGATQATEWTYKDGFGDFLSAYHGGTTPEFFGAHAWNSMGVFQGEPYSPLWDVSVFDIGAISTYDFNGDGKDEVIEGDAQWGNVNIYDGQTHALTLSIPHSAYSSAAVAAADLDHDGRREIAYASEQVSSVDDEVFALYDADDGSTLWRLDRGPSAPYAGSSVVSAGAPGVLRFLFGATASYSFLPAWAQLDGMSGGVLWQSDADDETLPDKPTASISVADIGDGPGFVVAGLDSYQPVMVAMDDATHTVRWQIGAGEGQPLQGRSVATLATAPGVGGAPDAGLACLDEGSGARLFTFGLADGQPSWTSVLMSSYCVGTMAGDFGGGSNLLVAVLGSTLRAYDAGTHLLAWSLPESISGATLLDGVGAREFVVFSGSQLTFYDASTRTVLRQFDLGEPVLAVQELGGIHDLVVAAGGHLLLVDGADGQVRATSDYLGSDFGAGNQLATQATNGQWFVGAVSSAGAFRFLVGFDELFENGFDG